MTVVEAVAVQFIAVTARGVAEARQAEAIAQQSTALAAKATAETGATVAAAARETLVANLKAQLIAAQATQTATPTATPTSPSTPLPDSGPTPTLTPLPTPTVNFAATATLEAVQTVQAQLAQVQAAQTAAAETSTCPRELQPEIRKYWSEYERQLGCPIQDNPTNIDVEQRFEHGYMFWSRVPDQFIVIIGDDSRTWHRFSLSDITWSWNPSGGSCEINVPPGLLQPVRGFGGLWCARSDIRDVIGFAKTPELGDRNYPLIEFEHGAILIDRGNNFVYILFKDGSTYTRAVF